MTFISSTTRTQLREWLPGVGVLLFLGFVIPFLPAFAGIAHAAATAVAAPAAPAAQATNTNLWGPLGGLISGVAQLLFSLAGFLFGLVGMLFNWIVVLTVFQFGSYFGNSAGMLIAWGVLRDIGNIILLFGFIFMGILMILDLDHGGSKKAIPGLIIFAILLNFSLFASEAVVDVSNVLSASIFNQAGQCTSVSGCGLTAAGSSATATTNTGISGVIMGTLGLGTLFNPSTATSQNLDRNGTQFILFLIGSSIFVTIAAVVLLAGAIMLFIRAITLVFLLVVSPIGFAAMAIPPLSGMANRWWKMLISQAFFAPVFLLLILVSVKILSGIGTQTGSGSSMSFADAIANPSSSNVGIFIIFALMIGFFIAALMAAKSLGAIGADFATNVATKTVRGTLTAPFRAAGYGGGIALRSVAGPVAATASRKYNTMIGNAVKQGGITGGIAKTFDHLAGTSIDNSLKKVQDTRFGGARSFTEENTKNAHRDEHTSHVAEISHLAENIKKGVKAANGTPEKDAMERALQQIPKAELENVVKSMNTTDRAAIGKALSTNKFKDLFESKELNVQQKEELFEGRYKDVEDAVNAFTAANTSANFTAAKDKIRALSEKELEIIAINKSSVFENMVNVKNDPHVVGGTGESAIKETVLEKIEQNDSYTSRQRDLVKKVKKTEQLKAVLAEAPSIAKATAIKNIMDNSGKELGKDDTLMKNVEVSGHMRQQHLVGMVAENSIKSAAERQQILRNIEAGYAGRMHTPEYTTMKTYVEKNAAAKGFFGGNTLA